MFEVQISIGIYISISIDLGISIGIENESQATSARIEATAADVGDVEDEETLRFKKKFQDPRMERKSKPGKNQFLCFAPFVYLYIRCPRSCRFRRCVVN